MDSELKDLVLTPRNLKAIAIAHRYARSRGRNFVRSEDLLVGLVRSEGSTPEIIGRLLGVNEAEVVRRIVAQADIYNPPPISVQPWSDYSI